MGRLLHPLEDCPDLALTSDLILERPLSLLD